MALANVNESKTLADKVSANFYNVRLRKAIVSVPKIKNTKKKAKLAPTPKTKEGKISFPSIVEMLIKSAVEDAKKENARKKPSQVFLSEKDYTILKEDKENAIGGYGAVSKA